MLLCIQLVLNEKWLKRDDIHLKRNSLFIKADIFYLNKSFIPNFETLNSLINLDKEKVFLEEKESF
jgi:hypothetical protein